MKRRTFNTIALSALFAPLAGYTYVNKVVSTKLQSWPLEGFNFDKSAYLLQNPHKSKWCHLRLAFREGQAYNWSLPLVTGVKVEKRKITWDSFFRVDRTCSAIGLVLVDSENAWVASGLFNRDAAVSRGDTVKFHYTLDGNL